MPAGAGQGPWVKVQGEVASVCCGVGMLCLGSCAYMYALINEKVPWVEEPLCVSQLCVWVVFRGKGEHVYSSVSSRICCSITQKG